MLKETDVNIKAQSENQVTPLCFAVQNGNLKIVKYLLENKADVNSLRADTGGSVLLIAVQNKRKDIVKYLLEHNADPSMPDIYGAYPIHYAAQNGNLELVKLLAQRGDINIKSEDNNQITPLGLVAENGSLEIVRCLLENKADPNIPNKKGACPIHGAVVNGHLYVVKILTQHNANVNIETNKEKVTPLYYAIAYSGKKVDTSIVKYLLEQNADPNSGMCDGDTPMHMAGYRSRIDLIKILLDFDGNLESVNNKGETPLYCCIKDETTKPNEKLAFVKYLIAKGVNLNLETETSLTELSSQHLPDAVTYLEHPEQVRSIEEIEMELSGTC